MQKLTSNTLTIFESATNEKDIENGYRFYFKTVIDDINFTSPYGCDGFGVSEKLGMRVIRKSINILFAFLIFLYYISNKS